MSRRFLSFSNSLFWVVVLLGSVLVFLRNKPTSSATLWTSSTNNYNIAVFTSPNKWGGTRWTVYRRPSGSHETSDWKHVMAMSSGEPIKVVKAWESVDGNRVLVVFPDSYFVANLKSGALEKATLVIGDEGDWNEVKSKARVYADLTFSKPRPLGPWMWQDREWKAMLYNDPQIRN
ncbi:hypothetical protein EON83_22525 [bacterium]|nr:MAG: hypothetical protein EON83_22525 [bacterium]